MSVEATYFTTSDSQFFAGTVAMINSLRLTGNRGKVIVFDLGLSDYQRERLSTIATVELPAAAPQAFPKALPAPDRATGTIVLIDSDMLVVASLRDSLEAAGQGKIVVFPDPDDRWFEEWRTTFALQAPLRRGRYANAGFVALSVEHWPWFLDRWAEVNDRIPLERLSRSELNPFRDTDQDALNAVLMSEVPPDATLMQPEWAEAHPDVLHRIRVVDKRKLTCTDDGRPVTILHQSMRPKTLESSGWRRDFREAYAQLLPRVLCWDDLPLRLEREDLPLWLKPTLPGRLVFRSLTTVHSLPGAIRATRAARRSTQALRSRRTARASA